MADTCVSRVPVFAGLSAQDQKRVEGLARPTHLMAGETAHSADDDRSQLMVLHTGRLKIFRLSADGSEQLIRVLGPGEFTGETSVFSGQRPDDYAIALDECRLCVFRHDDLEALIRKHPEIGLRMSTWVALAGSPSLAIAVRMSNVVTVGEVICHEVAVPFTGRALS